MATGGSHEPLCVVGGGGVAGQPPSRPLQLPLPLLSLLSGGALAHSSGLLCSCFSREKTTA